MKVAIMSAGPVNLSEALSAAVGANGHVHDARVSMTDLPRHAYDRIIVANLSREELGDIGALLHRARGLLRHDGRLYVIGQGADAPPFAHAVHSLEVNAWTIHRHIEMQPDEYLVEATITDESVQS